MRSLLIAIALMTGEQLRSQEQAIIDETFIEDFWLFPGHARSFITAIDKTVTPAGSLALFKTITHPTTDVALLQQRQALVQQFAAAQPLLREVREQLQVIVPMHDLVLQYCQCGNAATKEFENCYFKQKHLRRFNTNPVALNASVALLYTSLSLPLLVHLGQHLVLEGLLKRRCHHHHEENAAHGASNVILRALENKFIRTAVHWGVHAPSLIAMGQLMQNTATSIDHIARQVRQMAAFITVAQQLGIRLRSNKALADIAALQPLVTLQPASWDGLVGRLIALQRRSMWQVITWGEMLALHQQLRMQYQAVEQLAQALAALDLYSSLAWMVTQDTTWSYATYIERQQPLIQCVALTHPQVMASSHSNCCMGHDLSLGETVARHAIVTGANAAGKSTFMTSVMTAALLAQSIGIVPAKKWVMTPFAKLISYIRVASDITTGKSLFQVELARVAHITQQLENLVSTGHALLGIDEAFFQSTQAATGTKLAIDFLQHLAVHTNALSLTVTHNQMLTILEQWQANLFVNLVARCDYAHDGKKVYVVDRGVFGTQEDPLRTVRHAKDFAA